ncbi:MAG TPA: hypothetical protein VKP30_19115 [Polyangiaceae bacterium]|nr:hypothetical protein [Polyangiaceae bacterium]
MSASKPSQPSTVVNGSQTTTSDPEQHATPVDPALARVLAHSEAEEQVSTPVESVLERVLAQVDARSASIEPVRAVTPKASPAEDGLAAGWIEKWDGEHAVSVRLCPTGETAHAELMQELDRSLIEDAARERQLVLLDRHADRLLVIGVIATHKPKKLKLDAESIELLASRSLLLRVGRAALELRQDGNIEIVGSRISAASRGLFRLVGRMLRLN